MLELIINGAKITRVKTGNRYDKSITYMFRKRFNGKLKMPSTLAEKPDKIFGKK